MSNALLKEIDSFITETGLSGYRVGLLAASNGRLVERLRKGFRVWPETEMKVRAFILDARRNGLPRKRRSTSSAQNEARTS